jgi:hypothetical protein
VTGQAPGENTCGGGGRYLCSATIVFTEAVAPPWTSISTM